MRCFAICSFALSLLVAVQSPAAAEGSPAGAGFAPFGPGNGRIAVAFDPSSQTLFAGFDMGGLFRSADGGRTWAWSGRGLGRRAIRAIAVGASGEMYAGAESSSSIEILGSSDHGATWSPLGRLSRPWGGASLRPGKLVLGSEPGSLYLAIGRELWKSKDRGRRWSLILTAKGGLTAAVIGPSGEVYVGSTEPGARIWRSAEGGTSWEELYAPAGGVNVLALAPGTAGRPTKIYAGIGRSGLFESTDGGKLWQQHDPPDGALEIWGLAVDPANPETVYAAYRNGHSEPFQIRISVNGGSGNWTSAGLLMADAPPLWGVDLLVAGSTLYAFSEIDLAASTDRGWTWSYRLRSGTGPGLESKVLFAPGDPSTVYAMVGTRAFKSVDGGRTWASFATSLLQYGKITLRDLLLDPAHPGTFYAAGETGVHKSSDGGEHWRLIGPAARRLALLPGGVMLAGDCGLMRSSDGGARWEEVLPCNVSDGGQRRIEKILPDPAALETVFLSVAEYTPPPIVRQIYRSRDGGRTWMPIVGGANVLALSHRPPSILYVVQRDAVLESRDGGDTFRRAGPHLLPVLPRTEPIAGLLVDRTNPATLYAATRGFGLRRSTDGGATWSQLQAEGAVHPENEAPDYLFELLADPSRPDVLYAATGGTLVRVDL